MYLVKSKPVHREYAILNFNSATRRSFKHEQNESRVSPFRLDHHLQYVQYKYKYSTVRMYSSNDVVVRTVHTPDGFHVECRNKKN
jgi:hypothetical protein